MALGAGIDIIAISRMQGVLANSGAEAFLQKVYTSAERERSRQRPDPVVYLAKLFAAKEAIFKTFGIAGTAEVQFSDIEIEDGEFGEPLAHLSGRFAELARQCGVGRVLVSLSYDGDYAVAVAVLAETQVRA
jgi:phosphopantetheine--protein transferase-like protein